jgi:hypothetical protein
MKAKQVLAREVNDRIRELHAGFRITSGEYVVLCECGAPDCFERVAIPIEVYESLRARDDQALFTAAGHVPVAPVAA